MKRPIVLLAFWIAATSSLWSQFSNLGFGFRAGANYSRIEGPSEVSPDGKNLETFKNTGGFHIGALFNYQFTDLVGLRAELVYTQRGVKYEYNGPSYFILRKPPSSFVPIEGTRLQTLKVTNAFIDIPLEAYYKIGDFEIFGGVNAGLLVASTAGGSIDFNGIAPTTHNPVNPFKVKLNYNYKADDAGAASIETQTVNVDGSNYSVPVSVGAYYDFASRDKQLFKTLDLGLVAGISYFLNQGLFISARYIYGLGDVDRNEYDISLQALQSNGSTLPRSDKNSSRAMQFSVGFSF